MSNGSIIDISSGAAQSIGRYFSVISVVPSSLYVIFVYTLITSGSWQHSPNWSHAFKSLEQLGLGGVTLLAFLSIALGVIIHPAQFSLVQFFEGYWGNARIAQAIRVQRILRYQQFCAKLNNKKHHAEKERSRLRKSGVVAPSSRVRPLSAYSEASRVRDNFPAHSTISCLHVLGMSCAALNPRLAVSMALTPLSQFRTFSWSHQLIMLNT